MKRLIYKLNTDTFIDTEYSLPVDISTGSDTIHELSNISDNINTVIVFKDNLNTYGIQENTISLMKSLHIDEAIQLCNNNNVSLESMFTIEQIDSSLENIISRGFKMFIDAVMKFCRWIKGVANKFFNWLKSFFTKKQEEVTTVQNTEPLILAINDLRSSVSSGTENIHTSDDIQEQRLHAIQDKLNNAYSVIERLMKQNSSNTKLIELLRTKQRRIKELKALPVREMINQLEISFNKSKKLEEIEVHILNLQGIKEDISIVPESMEEVLRECASKLNNLRVEILKHQNNPDKTEFDIINGKSIELDMSKRNLNYGKDIEQFYDYISGNVAKFLESDNTKKVFLRQVLTELKDYNFLIKKFGNPTCLNNINKTVNLLSNLKLSLIDCLTKFELDDPSDGDMRNSSSIMIQTFVQNCINLQQLFLESSRSICNVLDNQVKVLSDILMEYINVL